MGTEKEGREATFKPVSFWKGYFIIMFLHVPQQAASVCLHSDAPHLFISLANPALIMSHASSSTQTQSGQIKEPFQL